jgi:hypothetical protein
MRISSAPALITRRTSASIALCPALSAINNEFHPDSDH